MEVLAALLLGWGHLEQIHGTIFPFPVTEEVKSRCWSAMRAIPLTQDPVHQPLPPPYPQSCGSGVS